MFSFGYQTLSTPNKQAVHCTEKNIFKHVSRRKVTSYFYHKIKTLYNRIGTYNCAKRILKQTTNVVL
jgi:hypothetical protein